MVRLHWLLPAHGRNPPAIQGGKTLLHRLDMIARRTARLGKPAHSVKTIRAGVFMALSMLLPPGKKWKTGWRRMAPRVVGQSAVDQAVSCFGHGLTLQHNAVELMQSALARTRSRIRTIGIGELREPAPKPAHVGAGENPDSESLPRWKLDPLCQSPSIRNSARRTPPSC